MATRAARAGLARDPGVARPLIEPLYQSTVFAFDSLAQLDDVYAGRAAGHVYYRMGTPNATVLEQAVATLEGGPAAAAAASGMGIITSLVLALAGSGDHVVADRHAYGGTHTLLTEELPRLGIEGSLLDVEDLAAVEAAIRPRTRAILVETLTNPTLRVADLPALVDIGHAHGVPVVVDNTFTTPAIVRPLDMGADVVWHSLAKYLGGHSGGMGGIAVGREDLIQGARAKVVHLGASIGPFDAWMVGHGLPTLPLRMDAHSRNALEVARFLESHPAVARVLYPGLPSHPDHAVARRLFGDRFGGMVSFSLSGGRSAAAAFLGALDLIAFAPSLADVTTTVSYPFATSHRGLPADTLDRLGIDEGLIRLSVGIEDVADISEDLKSALDAARAAAG
jgi:cystathionine gamma-synthase